MRRSKLELYEEILGTLVKKPLTIDSLAYETDMECAALNQKLDFLVKNELVEERASSKKTIYAITDRGLAVYKTLNFQKYLEKIANTIRTIDEAVNALPIISEDNKKEQDF